MLNLLLKLWQFLETKRKKQFVGLIGLTIITSFVEMISLSAIFPFITVLTQPEKIFGIPILGDFFRNNNLTSSNDLIIPISILFALAALIAGLMRLLLLKASILVSNSTGADLSVNVFERTLYQPYKIPTFCIPGH